MDEGLTTVSQAGQPSKFRSCFGEIKVSPAKKPYKPSGQQRKKPVSYFDTVKRESTEQSLHSV
jgi:hypothetical protein